MKSIILIGLVLMFKLSYSQSIDSTQPRIDKDTLFTSSGYKIVKGQALKMGTGSMNDGDFKFIRINSNSLFAYYSTNGDQAMANAANAFPRSQSGHTYQAKRLSKRGDENHGYGYNVIIYYGWVNYEIDIENAIASGEIVVPDEYKPKSKPITAVVEVKQKVSVADELIKLKKLYDEGVLTKEEFETQKKKVLNDNTATKN